MISGGKRSRLVEEELRRRVQSGEWSPGFMLPGRQRLAQEFGVALTTLERAVDSLIREGLLRADVGRGTFVRGATEESSRSANLSTRGLLLGVAAGRPEHLRERVITEEIERTFSEYGGAVIIAANVEMSLKQRAEILLQEQVDGLILLGYHASHDHVAALALQLSLQQRQTPVVAITSLAPGFSGIPYVCYDNVAAGYQAARHLMQGWRTGDPPLLVVAPSMSLWERLRISGVYEAVQEEGLPVEAIHILTGDTPGDKDLKEISYARTHQAKQRGEIPEIKNAFLRVLGVSDSTAQGARLAFEEMGYQLGANMALMGIGDSETSQALGLTSVRPPLEGMGREAVHLVTELIQGHYVGLAERQVCLRCHLILRSSTRIVECPDRDA